MSAATVQYPAATTKPTSTNRATPATSIAPRPASNTTSGAATNNGQLNRTIWSTPRKRGASLCELSNAGVFMRVQRFSDSAFPAVWNLRHVKGACQDWVRIGKRLQKGVLQYIDVYQFGFPLFMHAFDKDH